MKLPTRTVRVDPGLGLRSPPSRRRGGGRAILVSTTRSVAVVLARSSRGRMGTIICFLPLETETDRAMEISLPLETETDRAMEISTVGRGLFRSDVLAFFLSSPSGNRRAAIGVVVALVVLVLAWLTVGDRAGRLVLLRGVLGDLADETKEKGDDASLRESAEVLMGGTCVLIVRVAGAFGRGMAGGMGGTGSLVVGDFLLMISHSGSRSST